MAFVRAWRCHESLSVYLSDCYLNGYDLPDGDLTSSNLNGYDLTDGDLTGSNLNDYDLTDGDLSVGQN
nr:pentapeptide repeat-containing protein [Shewanella septentrionalis]